VVGWGGARGGSAVALLLCLAGCQTNVGDAGCRINKQIALEPTPLTQLRDARLEPVGDGFVLIGHDDTAVRWAPVTWSMGLGSEQTLPLPDGARKPMYALGGKDAPGDTLHVGVILDAAGGTDAELRLITVPVEGPTTAAPGDALVTFAGQAGLNPSVALGSSHLGINTGVTWVDPADGMVRFVAVDGDGAAVGAPTPVDDAAYSIACLGFSPGRGDMNVTYQRFPAADALPVWMISELSDTGVFMNWSLPIAQIGSPMSCAVVTPTPSGYAVAWQDTTGSWISIHTAQNFHVESVGFASATDFGGPDVQPPIVAVAPFETGEVSPAGGTQPVDFGIVFARTKAVEVWRLNGRGTRRPGALILPSMDGNLGNPSAVVVNKSLIITYADYTATSGRRLVVDASCY
jgi:hypothetical protein